MKNLVKVAKQLEEFAEQLQEFAYSEYSQCEWLEEEFQKTSEMSYKVETWSEELKELSKFLENN
tara:strand:+ start:46 stop:237 length:192 start_codon:yes stop_codon:yes gene_type:complete